MGTTEIDHEELATSFEPLLRELKNHKATMKAIVDRWVDGNVQSTIANLVCAIFTEIYENQINSNIKTIEQLIQFEVNNSTKKKEL